MNTLCRRLMFVTVVYLFDDLFGQTAERCAGKGVGLQGYGCAGISSFADALYKRDLSE
jgi:hypothetical protein